ncbi:MAG TPA: GGDEF domain-containing protein, partial [Ktedonobacteraceae bacterium]|nr:GGDEF domain-containing protein [Ktedonobacteraceae bacterium]
LADGLMALAQGDWSLCIKQRELPNFHKSQDEIGQITQSIEKIMTTLYNLSDIYEVTRQELQTLYTRIQEQNETLSIANAHLSSLATTDPLTGLSNHRAIMDHIDREIKRCQDTKRNCAIIFVDVDRFKCINDTWGHGAGDEVLHFVGQQLRACVRQEDYVGRYGGEEFAILLIDIEQREAFELAWRLRDAIAAQPYIWQVDEKRTVAISVTASFGLAVYPLDGVTRKELIERADAAMYVAKHGGRNRVCLPAEVVVDEEVVNAEAWHDPHPTRPLQTLTLV